jgi:hypothetical protein
LAWSDTSHSSYDEGDEHQEYASSTLHLSTELANNGIVSWIAGTGLENDAEMNLSPYGRAKIDLRTEVFGADDQNIRWISMPYIFSIFHNRPRIVSACMENQKLRNEDSVHDYLEIRDVAHQISQIIRNSDDKLTSVSSDRKISNLRFCQGIRKAASLQPVSDCNCQDESNYNPHQNDTYFTSLIFD